MPNNIQTPGQGEQFFTIEKVELPKVVLEELQIAINKGKDSSAIIGGIWSGNLPSSPFLIAYGKESKHNFDKILSALVNGAVPERSPEEKLLEVYREYRFDSEVNDNARLKAIGIKEALRTLGITIEGING